MPTSASATQQKAQYDADGTLFIPGLLEESDYTEVMDDLQLRIELLANREGITLPEEIAGPRITWLSECLKTLCGRDPRFQGILYDAMSRSTSLHRMSAHPRIVEVVKNLMGPRFEVHPRLILIMSLPTAKWHLAGWHQDWYYNEGPLSTMTLWIPMHDVDTTGGALTVALGRHNEGLMGHSEDEDRSTKWHTIQSRHVDSFEDTVDINAKAGDCLALHALAPHTAHMNQSSHVRFVLNFRYMDLEDPAYLESNWRVGDIKHARAALGRTTASA